MAVFKQTQFNGVVKTTSVRETARQSAFPADNSHLMGSRFSGVISDTVALLYPPGTPETPISRRVTLFDRATMRPIMSVWSDPTTGAYSFTNLNTAIPFLVLADDYTGTHNAVVGDWIYAD